MSMTIENALKIADSPSVFGLLDIRQSAEVLAAEVRRLWVDADRFKTVFEAWLDMDFIDMGLHTEVPTEKWDAFCELMLPNDAEFIAR